MLDKIDRDIIGFLRNNARLSYKELGELVFLSPNAVAERVKKLVDCKVLQGFEARVNLAALDLAVHALIDVKLKPDMPALDFEGILQTVPGVVEAYLQTGPFDYLLRVACRDQEDLMRLIEALRARGGVQDTQSRFILRHVQPHAPLAR